MVKRTIETYECDICGHDGERYTVSFPDGVLALDRCPRHDHVINKLRDEVGTWSTPATTHRSAFHVSSADDIVRQRRAKKAATAATDGVVATG